MSSHTFCLMEMCPSTVWHLVSHYFVWCERTINVMFTLKTLLGCVYVQLLTYEDVSVCMSLTWSPRMHTNVQLKTRSHTCVHVFLTKTYLYPSLSYETHVCITYFPITLTEKMFLYNFWYTRQRFWKIVCLYRRVCAQVLRLKGAGTNQNTVFCHAI